MDLLTRRSPPSLTARSGWSCRNWRNRRTWWLTHRRMESNDSDSKATFSNDSSMVLASTISLTDTTILAANTTAAKAKAKCKRKPRKKKRGKRKKPRGVNFVIEYSKFWSNEPIHAVIKRLRDKYELRWLRVSMSYKRFSNVRELYRTDLDKKLGEGITSEEFMDQDCNCKGSNIQDSKCIYGENCRKKCLVYKIKCRHCAKFYIGGTCDCFKNRADGHCSATCTIANKSKYSNVWRTAWSNHANIHLGISHQDAHPISTSRIVLRRQRSRQ